MLSHYPSLLGKWLSRYENKPFCYFMLKCHFSYFCSSNGHTLYQTLIGNWLLQFYKVHIYVNWTSGSPDIIISHFSYFFAKCVTFSHFCWSNGYTLYETLVGNWMLRFCWALIQVHWESGSRDMKISHFATFLPKVSFLAISVHLMDIHYIKHL